MILTNEFFARDAFEVGTDLIGKVLCHKYEDIWLKAMIIETESYYANEPGSHSSKGQTMSKKALYMPPGTLYLYYSRGSDSISFSTLGEGNAVLIKSGIPLLNDEQNSVALEKMHQLNPINGRRRKDELLCSGQTLICKSLGIKVKQWNQKAMNPQRLYVEDIGYKPEKLIACKRLGIPANRHHHLLHRVFDEKYAKSITKDPRTKNAKMGVDYKYI